MLNEFMAFADNQAVNEVMRKYYQVLNLKPVSLAQKVICAAYVEAFASFGAEYFSKGDLATEGYLYDSLRKAHLKYMGDLLGCLRHAPGEDKPFMYMVSKSLVLADQFEADLLNIFNA